MKRGTKLLLFTFKLILAIIVVICALIAWLSRPFPEKGAVVDIYDLKYYIAHAGGGINGSRYTNSKEALLNSIESGYQKIELDLYLTSDSNVVCLHSLNDYIMMTGNNLESLDTETFKNSRLFGIYTPMTLEDALKIWESKPFTMVTDKISDINILNKYFKHDRQRVMVEAFNYLDYVELEKDGYMPMLSFGTNPQGLFFLAYSSVMSGFKIKNICVASVRLEFLLRMFKRLGLNVAIWTKNNPQYYQEHLGVDVDLIYTDYWMIKNDTTYKIFQ